MKDQIEIQDLLEQWAQNIKTGKQHSILKNHSESVVIYDVLPPLKYEGVEAYRKVWEAGQPGMTRQDQFDLHDLKIVSRGDTAFAYGYIYCAGTLPEGRTFEDCIRATFCLEKENGKWLVTHQHTSMPRR